MNTTEQTMRWRKSSYTLENGSCVEVGTGPDVVGVRDTKDRAGGTLMFSRAAWAGFLAAVRENGRITR